MEARFHWAENHQNHDWKRVVFSDECSFALNLPRSGWSPKGSKIHQKSLCYNPKLQVWAAISSQGLISYAVYEGTMDQYLYLSILEHEVIPPVEQKLGRRWEFQQGNATPRRAKIVQNFLEENTPQRLVCPSRSPGLSPIENLWAKVKQKVYSQNPQDMMELKVCIVDEMENTLFIRNKTHKKKNLLTPKQVFFRNWVLIRAFKIFKVIKGLIRNQI